MITVKQAIEAARAAATEYFGSDIRDLRLEEVRRSQSRWYITLGFLQLGKPPVRVLGSVEPEYERVYKVFEVDGETAEVEAMKIRPND